MIRSVLAVAARQRSFPRSATAASLSPEEQAVLHHGQRPRHRDNPKFNSPRKRASKLFSDLQTEAIQKSKAAKPAVWEPAFRVGDAIELKMGRTPEDTEKIRGVVIGVHHKGLDESVLL